MIIVGMSDLPPSAAGFDGVLALPDWGVIRATGPDAANFLQGQLTQDIAGLAPGQARLAGYCSAKGRLLASFIAWRPAPDSVLLACSADVLPATLKRLSMFVLRAKAQLTDASQELPVHGLAGSEAAALASRLGPWQVAEEHGGFVLRLPDADGVPRALRFGAMAPAAQALAPEAWSWLEVMSAVPRITASTAEQFVPQMVNLELLDGVNFRKGCYPGQEVVARSQYRGTLKRRSFLLASEGAAQPGQEVFHEADPAQPAGMVVNAASLNQRHVLLAELKLSVLDHGTLRLGAPDGPLLQRLPMPYEVPLDASAAA
jgi:folate-binding protein YgfZ